MTSPITIALDSNIYRNQDFIDFLIMYKDKIKPYLPSIVQLEVGYYYLTVGLKWMNFTEEVQKYGGVLLKNNSYDVQAVVETAYQNRVRLPFKQHFRDYIIGIEAIKNVKKLITYNTRHFDWITEIGVETPEELILELIS